MFSISFSTCRAWLLALLSLLPLAVVSSLAQRPLGTDVSGYQPNISWPYAKNNGVTFGWAKATESTGYVNPEYAEQIASAKAVGVFMGSYHFSRPSQNPNITGADSAESEAQFFWSVASNYIKPGGFYMMPMLDWEDANMTNQLSAATCSAWVNQWCTSVSNYAFAAGVTGVKPVVYTGIWYSKPSSTYSGLTTAVTNWTPWIASYPTTPNPQTGGPTPGTGTFPWPNWTFWQYADTNWTGGDSDVFNGTAAGLSTYIVSGLGLPYFVSQPSSRTTDPGTTLTLRTVANGALPLKYQWRFGGTNLLNATNAAINNFLSVSDDIKAITGQLRKGDGTAGKFLNDETLYLSLDRTVRQAETLLSSIREGDGTFSRLINDPVLYDQVTNTVTQLRGISDQINTQLEGKGKGTIGKLIKDDEIYNKANTLIAKANDISAKLDSVMLRIERGEGNLGKLIKDEQLYADARVTIEKLKGIADRLEKGEGTAGLLLKDEKLYNNVNTLSTEVTKLIYDFRQNPKKYLSVKVTIF